MPITIDINEDLALHVIRLEGAVSFDELSELGRLHQTRPDLAAADAVHIVDEAADLSKLTPDHIDAMRSHYRDVQRAIDFHVVRRAAWICPSPRAWKLGEYWVAHRHSRDGQGTEICLVADLADAAALFSPEELAAVRARQGFVEFARIEGAAGAV